MARVSLDGKVWKDPRVKRLAKRQSMTVREVVGTLAAVWDVAYDNKSPEMPRVDVDTAADVDGFATDMVIEQLADELGDGSLVRLHGVSERIQYLLAQAERGRRGGQAKGKRTLEQTLGDGSAPAGAFAKQPPSLPSASSIPSASASASASAVAPDPEHRDVAQSAPVSAPAAGSTKAKQVKREPEATPDEIAAAGRVLERLGDAAKVSYAVRGENLRLVLARMRDGYDEHTLRAIVAYVASPKAAGGRGWEGDERMAEYLRPKTLFGPKKIDEYADPARSWYARQKPTASSLASIPRLNHLAPPPADDDLLGGEPSWWGGQ